jgi:hypothetical protein
MHGSGKLVRVLQAGICRFFIRRRQNELLQAIPEEAVPSVMAMSRQAEVFF